MMGHCFGDVKAGAGGHLPISDVFRYVAAGRAGVAESRLLRKRLCA